MRGYESNNCRLCEKTFCCENCRVKHETIVHKIFPNCDICVYGQFTFGNLDDHSLKHLEDCHLPLHCVYCKRIFKSIKEILQHRKCQILQNKEDSPKTPFRETPIIISNEDNQSPILQGQENLKHIFNLATSTPMQKGTEVNIFEKSREPLTPVDKGSLLNSKSIIKKVDSIKSENSSNRRVTFGNTPTHNSVQKKINVTDKVGEATIENDKIKENIKTESEIQKITTNDQNKDSNSKQVDNLEASSRHQNNSTPNVGISNDQFYSAKSEQSTRNNFETIQSRQNIKIEEAFTPVCASNNQKLKVPVCKKDFDEEASPNINNDLGIIKPKDNLKEVSMNLCTPEPVKIISRIERNAEKEMSPIIENTKESNETSSDDTHHENNSQINQNTMWLSAINSEAEENDVIDGDSKESSGLENEIQLDNNTKQTSPPKTNRKVSIYVASPMIQRTDVQMKFQFPAHLSSTPIMSHNTLKIQRTKIVEEISTKLVACQTPFKTPQGKLFRTVQRKLGQNSNVRRNFITSNLQEPTTSENVHEKRNHLNGESDEEVFFKDNQENNPSVIKSNTSESHISVSSMTESSLWSSMTKIAKNVLGRLRHASNPEISYNTHSASDLSSSFKRQHSESDDMFDVPRSKRFKFSDIKCRRPIRQSNELVPILKLPSSNNALARLEIVKSVTTMYGNEKIRIQCNKSTQTDDYLMYGWCPKI
ncbi:uncharacterized protein LOC143197629 isoform X2 [Rhynchophorus ferrugineus]|uniref:uncharacterized protein LOC143197629 isoform X2 n=1 Tax=Rhynchophorus ferrugineus TaxID=354439 RepID=UPI003FCEB449